MCRVFSARACNLSPFQSNTLKTALKSKYRAFAGDCAVQCCECSPDNPPFAVLMDYRIAKNLAKRAAFGCEYRCVCADRPNLRFNGGFSAFPVAAVHLYVCTGFNATGARFRVSALAGFIARIQAGIIQRSRFFLLPVLNYSFVLLFFNLSFYFINL